MEEAADTRALDAWAAGMSALRDSLLALLRARYGEDVPAFVRGRFDTEFEYVWIGGTAPFLRAYEAVARAAAKAGESVWNRGYGCGSLLFWLLGGGVNPLPPHWRCGACGRVEAGEGAALCFGLPPRECPGCGSPMARDGVACPAEEALRGGLEIRVNEGFLDAACRAALDALPGVRVLRQSRRHAPGPAGRRAFYAAEDGALPEGLPVYRGPDGAECVFAEDVAKSPPGLLQFTFVVPEDGPVPGEPLPVEAWMQRPPDVEPLLRGMRDRGGDLPGGALDRMARLAELLQPRDWGSLVETACFAFGNYSRLGEVSVEELARRIRESPFRHALYCREALQEYLQGRGVPAILAWQMARQVSTGRKGWEMGVYGEKTPELAGDELFRSAGYLWSRTHAVEWMGRNMPMR
ncbi:MAG TPA: hypothetical protein VLA21_08760 [Candidatus Limnocylindria bacterium]|nr:hypothetical protein [Candidatus Limnocylindria bacterium]